MIVNFTVYFKLIQENNNGGRSKRGQKRSAFSARRKEDNLGLEKISLKFKAKEA
jgi:hypothetical protein